MDVVFFNNAGNSAVYQEGSAFVPAVVLGAALAGMQAIGRPSETTALETGLRIAKDPDNWQLWRAEFCYSNTTVDEWYKSGEALQEAGTLTYGDTVSVTAVPIAEHLTAIIEQLDYDAPSWVYVSTSTFTLNKSHHGKTLIFAGACTVTFDMAYMLRPFVCSLVQAGTGQITLPSAKYNGATTNATYVVPNAQYHRTDLYLNVPSWGYHLVTV